MKTEVMDQPDRERYEIRVGGELAGFADYVLTPGMITFTHTEIDKSFEGKGIGSALTRESLDDVRERGLTVLPVCPFVKGWIERHPEYLDLVHRTGGGRTSGDG